MKGSLRGFSPIHLLVFHRHHSLPWIYQRSRRRWRCLGPTCLLVMCALSGSLDFCSCPHFPLSVFLLTGARDWWVETLDKFAADEENQCAQCTEYRNIMKVNGRHKHDPKDVQKLKGRVWHKAYDGMRAHLQALSEDHAIGGQALLQHERFDLPALRKQFPFINGRYAQV